MQKIKIENENRIETGAIQFNDDWPGYFLRGDSALSLAVAIQWFLEEIKKNKIPNPTTIFEENLISSFANDILKNVRA